MKWEIFMTYTLNLNNEQVNKIISLYHDYKLELTTPYMIFRAKIKMATITIYKTNKLLIQGNDSIQVYQEICQALRIKPKITKPPQKTFDLALSIIGSDEVGTGDYFGGIVVCACFIGKEQILETSKLGLNDSKKISDQKIKRIAPQLISKLKHSVIYLNNEKYNLITNKFNTNLNKIKAILHNKALIQLLDKNINYDKIIIDGFTSTEKYFSYLQNQKRIIENVILEEKSETKYLAVAVASIIARYYFIKKLDELSKTYGYNLPKGAGKPVDLVLNKIITDGKKDILKYIAKVNFQNTNKFL